MPNDATVIARITIRICGALAVVIGLCGSSAQADETVASASRPNVVIIYTDDQGYGDVGCMNPEAKFSTPNLDRLAAEGITFTNAHSSDTVCTPSRYGLLTGRYCWRTTRKAGVMGAEGACLIARDRMTIASLLRERGYATCMVGKWHLGMEFPGEFGQRDWSMPTKEMPLDRGFEQFFGIPASLNYGVLAWFDGRHVVTPPTRFTGKKPNARHVDYRIKPPYQATPGAVRKAIGMPKVQVIEVASDFVDNQCLTRFTNKAVSWIESQAAQERPFFLYLPFTSPHYPVCPLPEFHGQGRCGGYGEFMIETDAHVGRILDCLDRAGVSKDTLVIFTSDNGPEKSYQQRRTEFGHQSNGPFRGGKRDIYEGGHRVPMLIRWPEGIQQPGRESNQLVGQTDVLATVAELIQAEVPNDAAEDSESFAKLLVNAEHQGTRLPLINHGAKGRFSVTDGHWKLVLPHRKLSTELYDLSADPTESKNVAGKEADRVKEMMAAITNIVCHGRTTPGVRQANDTGYWADLKWLTQAEYESASKR